ncbi:MAG: glycoside hydrolase family 13 protein [Oscillospiraceae bacterium]|nr:glycoside hydrolase family 13 protein [Oscillospiraceae bacterium]
MIYASRSSFHKTPFGAVKAGEAVTFTLTPPRAAAWLRAFLCVKDEFGGQYTEYALAWSGLRGACDMYRVRLDTEGLLGPVWYWFRFEGLGGRAGYCGNPGLADGECALTQETPLPWQLTVTLPDPLPVPGWFGRGVTYHIFPDRFHKGKAKTPALKNMPGDRTLHKDWFDCPDFRPDDKGEVRNRDFFGGNLVGVREKLPYIQKLGVKTIYFSPIFEAASNHRYDTASYARVDPLFGTEEEFSALCAEASALDIRVILDGVFNHTGYNSEYFNGAGFYKTTGASQSKKSPYYDWYNWQRWPDKYDSWWGIYTLPQVNESHPSYMDYIVRDGDSVVRRWLRAGASGWRLDVADELPGPFIEELTKAARSEKEDAVVIGEVWEDASNKIAYDVRRRYLLGRELDGVMNYPLRDSLIGFILGGDAGLFKEAMETLRENYPRDIYYNLMNALGTHDTPRILTVLGATPEEWAQPKEGRAETALPPERRALALRRLKLAAAVLFTFPGSPTVYYGDEAGLEGFEDPFNRRGYPWGREDKDLLKWYAKLGKIRNASEALQSGDIRYLYAEGGLLVYDRAAGKERVTVCVNRSEEPAVWTVGNTSVPLQPIGVKILRQDAVWI